MNEQELANLFSEQVDRMLQGESVSAPPDTDDLQELLDFIGRPTSQTQFEASPAAQSAFQSQMASWSGPVNGGSPMTILGLSKIWFISIIVTVVVAVAGLGSVAVIVTSVFLFSDDDNVEVTVVPGATDVAAGTPVAPPNDDDDDDDEEASPPPSMGTPVISMTITPPLSVTVVPSTSITMTVTPPVSATVTPPVPVTMTVTPPVSAPIPPVGELLPIYFRPNLRVPSLCQGAYTAQQVLVNSSAAPVDDAALAWEVIEGADFIETVNVDSPALEAASAGDGGSAVSESPVAPNLTSSANFSQISAQEEVKIDVKVKVNDKWWKQDDGTKIKVKIKIKSKVDQDDKGHDDDDDNDDGDDDHGSSQAVTIVKQGASWITLSGVAHPYDDNALLVDGNVVVINNCSGLPPQLPPGSNVEVIGTLLPDGTFIVINIIIININIITGDFDSGVPVGGDDGGSGGGDSGGSGGGKGGSKKGGSKKGGSGGS